MISQSAEQINQRYPVTGLKFFSQGIEVIRTSNLNRLAPGGQKKALESLSKSSLSRLAFLAQNTKLDLLSMLTLTYGAICPSDGLMVRASRNRFLSYMRSRFTPLGYIWFLEFTKAGRPHLHILLSIVPQQDQRGQIAAAWTKASLIPVVGKGKYYSKEVSAEALKVYNVHAHSKTWQAIKSRDGARGYITAYAAKPYQKTVPKEYWNVGRFWGNSRGASPVALSTQGATEQGIRLYLKSIGHRLADCEVLPRFISTYQSQGVKLDKEQVSV